MNGDFHGRAIFLVLPQRESTSELPKFLMAIGFSVQYVCIENTYTCNYLNSHFFVVLHTFLQRHEFYYRCMLLRGTLSDSPATITEAQLMQWKDYCHRLSGKTSKVATVVNVLRQGAFIYESFLLACL